jgi:hypothetical protein
LLTAELLNEVVVEALAHADRFQADGQPRAWLLGIAANSETDQIDLVDNWSQMWWEDFENTFPLPTCEVNDQSPNPLEQYWDDDDYRAAHGSWAAWPANGGQHGVDPEFNGYPANLETFIVCGPFDVSQADKLMVEFSFWLDIFDPADEDFFAFGVAPHSNPNSFRLTPWWGQMSTWGKAIIYVEPPDTSDQLWFAWYFTSNNTGSTRQGAWIDDLAVWHYEEPAIVCGNSDPGAKGIVLSPYDPATNGALPIIRSGHTAAANNLAGSGVDWVRLGLHQKGGVIDWRAYDRMIDTLCVRGISTLGLINQETLVRQDYNLPDTADEYRADFAARADFIARYFAGRVNYWEVWNEPNLDDELGGAELDPEHYGLLLNETYSSIKTANSTAEVLFGGLASAWDDSDLYFQEVYASLLPEEPLFDFFALHPYPNDLYTPDPTIYMHADPGADTIIDKFLRTMFLNNDGDKKIWVTEVGWNSALESLNRPTCHDGSFNVTEADQAAYLKPMLDILFNEVHLWNDPNTAAVAKVIWYQYMDIGHEDPCGTDPDGEVDWWFGLYQGDEMGQKEVWCPYRTYPLTCAEFFQHHIHLPFIKRP